MDDRDEWRERVGGNCAGGTTIMMIAYITNVYINDQSYCKDLTICFLFLWRLKLIFAETILWLQDSPSKEE